MSAVLQRAYGMRPLEESNVMFSDLWQEDRVSSSVIENRQSSAWSTVFDELLRNESDG